MSLPPTEEAHRLSLYNQGLTDPELAAAFGTSRMGATSWRHNRGLVCNKVQSPRPYCRESVGVLYKDALEPEQWRDMHDFLGSLGVAAKREKGRVNVGAFINEWRRQGGG